MVDRFYAILNEFLENENPHVLEKFDELYQPVKRRDGTLVLMYGGALLYPLFITWIATLEKIRFNKPLSEPFKVVFSWNHHIVYDEGGKKSIQLKFDGVNLQPADQDTISRHFGRTPEVLEKLLGRKPTDWDKAKQEGKVISFDKNTNWDNIEFDVENQQIIIRDPDKKDITIIDLKKSGLTLF